MRTHDQIVKQCQQEDDMLGFTAEALLPFLPVEKVKPFLKEDADLSDWKEQPLTAEAVIAEMREYMEFAWGKVQDHRGISASRSVTKMQAWLWLLEDNETLAFAQKDSNYAQYGAPVLKKVCQKYGFPIPEGEDVENMSQGNPCEPGCTYGCG